MVGCHQGSTAKQRHNGIIFPLRIGSVHRITYRSFYSGCKMTLNYNLNYVGVIQPSMCSCLSVVDSHRSGIVINWDVGRYKSNWITFLQLVWDSERYNPISLKVAELRIPFQLIKVLWFMALLFDRFPHGVGVDTFCDNKWRVSLKSDCQMGI